MTHLSSALERATYAVSSAFGLGLLWVSAPAAALLAQAPAVQSLAAPGVPPPRWDYTLIAGAVLAIGMNLATVLVTLYRGIRKVRDESLAGQLLAANVRNESIERECKSAAEHRERWFADELAHRDQREKDRDREAEHARVNRDAVELALRDDVKYLRAAVAHHVATEAELRRMLDDYTQKLAASLVQSTQNTSKLLEGVVAGPAGPTGPVGPPGPDGLRGERGERGEAYGEPTA